MEEDEIELIEANPIDDTEWPKPTAEKISVTSERWERIKPTMSQKKRKRHARGGVHAVHFLEEECGPEVQNLESSDEMVWVKVDSVMDSGCAQPVAPAKLASHVPIVPIEASRRGAEYQTAGGGKLVNQGARTIQSLTMDWEQLEMIYNVVDVVKPSNSV